MHGATLKIIGKYLGSQPILLKPHFQPDLLTKLPHDGQGYWLSPKNIVKLVTRANSGKTCAFLSQEDM